LYALGNKRENRNPRRGRRTTAALRTRNNFSEMRRSVRFRADLGILSVGPALGPLTKGQPL